MGFDASSSLHLLEHPHSRGQSHYPIHLLALSYGAAAAITVPRQCYELVSDYDAPLYTLQSASYGSKIVEETLPALKPIGVAFQCGGVALDLDGAKVSALSHALTMWTAARDNQQNYHNKWYGSLTAAANAFGVVVPKNLFQPKSKVTKSTRRRCIRHETSEELPLA